MSAPIDVLIVGAGPTGLMLALSLMKSLDPPRIRIVDKAPRRSMRSRAIVVQPRSLELLQKFDIQANDSSLTPMPRTNVSSRL